MRWKTATVLGAVALAALLLLKYGPHDPPSNARRPALDLPKEPALWLYRPSTSEWLVWTRSGGGRALTTLGQPGALPVRAQSASARSWFGTFHPETGAWTLHDERPYALTWGQKEDVPVPADYIGDSTVDVAVWRPSTGAWLIRDGGTGHVASLSWGVRGDIPVPADYDGDGRADPAVWRPSNGGWYIARLDGRALGTAAWGRAGDIPVPGNYDGDRAAELAVFRPAAALWFVRPLEGAPLATVQFGNPGDVPAPVDLDDSGVSTPGVWQPARTTWRVRRDQGPQVLAVFGAASDVPVTTPPARLGAH